MPVVFAMDTSSAARCREVGLDVREGTPSADLLRAVDAVVLGPEGLERLRTWRMAGHGVQAVLLDGGAVPAGLEPLRRATGPDLLEVVETVVAERALRTLRLPGGTADLDRLSFVRDDGEELRLSQREADLLLHLARNPHREVDRDEVQTEVFGHARAVMTRAVDMAVSRLRKKIERDPRNPMALLTARGGGYRLALDEPDPDGLVGRTALLREVLAALADGGPVTLKGPPGVGKTRLAEAVLERRAGRLVRLEGIARPESLAVAVTAQLDGRADAEPEGDDALLDALEDVGGVVVLDNAEHLAGAVADLVGRVISELPDLPLLVTSQRALDLPGERVIEVPPLDVDASRTLFLAQVAEPPPPDVLDALLDALEGLPLAIRLAGGWAGLAPWDRLPALGADSGLGERIEAALRLLSPADRQAVAGLASFASTFGVDDVAALNGTGSLPRLVAASLVQVEPPGFRLLDPVRAHLRGRTLDASILERHHTRIQALAREAVDRLGTGDDAEPRRALAARLGDLERAWATRADPWLALALVEVHRAHGGAERCRELVRVALEGAGDPDARLRLALHHVFLHPAQELQQRMDAVEATWEAALDPRLKGRALAEVAWVRYRRSGDTAPAERALQFAEANGLLAEARLASYVLGSQAVRQDATALRRALPSWEATVLDLEALEAYPYALRVAGSVASTWASLGDPARSQVAMTTLARLLERHPDGYYAGLLHNLRAYERMDAGDFAGALDAFEAMRRVRFGRRGLPDAVWLKNRAYVLLDAGRRAEAERDLEAVLPRLEHLPVIQVSTAAILALCKLDAGDGQGAEEVLEAWPPPPDITAVALAYTEETRAMAAWMRGDAERGRARHAALDPDLLGPESAAAMRLQRAATGDAEALATLAGFESDSLTSRKLHEVLAAFDDPERLEALQEGGGDTPVLVRIAARLRLVDLRG